MLVLHTPLEEAERSFDELLDRIRKAFDVLREHRVRHLDATEVEATIARLLDELVVVERCIAKLQAN